MRSGPTHFVDRQEPIDFCLAIAQAGQGQNILVIQGENGIGKTALLEELARRCGDAGLLCAHVDFVTRREYSSYPNFLSAVTDLWLQLDLGTFEELCQLVTALYPGGAPAPASLPEATGGSSNLPHVDQITGTIRALGEGAQAAIGSNIVQIQGQFTQIIQQGDVRISEPLIRADITRAFQARLRQLTARRRTVIFLDSWDTVLTGQEYLRDPGAWICDELLNYLANGSIENCVTMIASAAEPALGDVMRQVRRIALGPLPAAAVEDYFRRTVTVSIASEALQQLVEISQGIPLAMHLLADGVNGQQGSQVAPAPQRGEQAVSVVISFAVERYLESLPISVVAGARIAALPHRPTRTLLAKLGVSEADIDAVRQCSFVLRSADQESFAYHPSVRMHFLQWWDANEPGRYRELNRLLLAHFTGLVAGSGAQARSVYEPARELFYHRLIDDEGTGFDYLAERFEDAADQFALDLAEGLIQQGAELERRGLLAESGSLWLEYFHARLNLLKNQGDRGETTFVRLAATAPVDFLGCLARWNSGILCVDRNQWSEGVSHYRASLAGFRRLKKSAFAIRTMLALGNAYRSFAAASGGIPERSLQRVPAARNLLYLLRDLPFTVYEQLVRRVRFLPSWYFGTNYQNWIVAYLLTEGAKWYRGAEAEQAKSGGTQLQFEIQLPLADIEHRLNRWSRAWRRYSLLMPAIAEDAGAYNYRRAQVSLGQGRILFDERKFEAAEAHLQDALQTLQFFADSRSAAFAGELLAQIYAALNQPEQAVEVYRQSLQAYRDAGDGLGATRAACLLEELAAGPSLPANTADEAKLAAAQVRQRQYLVRFPDRLLRWFRRLALLGALPLTYLLTLFFGLALIITAFILEGEIVLALHGWNAGTALGDAAVLAAAAVAPVFLIVWFYRLVYTLLGMAVVYVLGRRLSPIENAQPALITCDEQSLTCEYLRDNVQTTIPWSEATGFISMHYCLRRRPIELLSGSLLTSQSGQTIILEAVTTGYRSLLRDVKQHLKVGQPGLAMTSCDFAIFDRRWTLVNTIVVALFAAFLLITGIASLEYKVTPSAVEGLVLDLEAAQLLGEKSVLLWLTSAIFAFLPAWLLFGAAAVVWRLTFHQVRLRKLHPRRRPSLPVWLVALIALGLSLLTVVWAIVIFVSQ